MFEVFISRLVNERLEEQEMFSFSNPLKALAMFWVAKKTYNVLFGDFSLKFGKNSYKILKTETTLV